MNPVVPPVRIRRDSHPATPREMKLLALVFCMVIALAAVVIVLYTDARETKIVTYQRCVVSNEKISDANDYYRRIANVVRYSTSIDEPTKKGLITAYGSVRYPLADCGEDPR